MFKRAQFKELESSHYAIDTILHGQSEDALPMLIRHCDNERLDEKSVKKIGF